MLEDVYVVLVYRRVDGRDRVRNGEEKGVTGIDVRSACTVMCVENESNGSLCRVCFCRLQ